MERKQAALDGQSDGQDAEGHGNGNQVRRVLRQPYDRLLHGYHQQMARDVIEQDDSEQKQTRAKQVHDHVADRRQSGPADFTDDQDSAARQSQDLEEYVAGENVICPKYGHDRRRHEIDQRVVEVLLALIDIDVDEAGSSKHRTEHDHQK